MDSLEAIKTNILYGAKIVREVYAFLRYVEMIDHLDSQGYKINKRERAILVDSINSLMFQLKIINNSIPELIKKISFYKELPKSGGAEKIGKKDGEGIVSFSYKRPSAISVEKENTFVTIKKEDKKRFLEELGIVDTSLKRIKRNYSSLSEKVEKFKKPSIYAKISNKFFSKISNKLVDKGYFPKIGKHLRKANLPFLSNTYISMAFFSTAIAFVFSIIFLIFLLFFRIGLSWPFLTVAEESILLRFGKNFWVIFAIPIAMFIAFYFYPLTESKSIESKINQELPFAVIHMSAIAGSGVEPTEIFKIIVLSREYPNVKKELKKLINQINLYGYDLVTALRNSSRLTSSTKLAELLNGLSTTITSGGNLKDFLDKRAETLIFDYRLEREKSTKLAETFMNIYISVVIAAPMIMTLLLVMINLTNMSFGLTMPMITLLMVFGVAIINIIFLVFLHIKQPRI